mmetsp:Transcript_7820/g.20094  ORF Transcript_7820/g.20094 Transcript_7820/m.20094 type:complete len:204 (+) Transcript_7820:2-613(+)
MRSCRHAACPPSAAAISGDRPSSSCALMSAPMACSTNRELLCPDWAARMAAVDPPGLGASTGTPRFRSISSSSTLPVDAANRICCAPATVSHCSSKSFSSFCGAGSIGRSLKSSPSKPAFMPARSISIGALGAVDIAWKARCAWRIAMRSCACSRANSRAAAFSLAGSMNSDTSTPCSSRILRQPRCPLAAAAAANEDDAPGV